MASGRIPSVEGGIQPTILDAKGDLIVATAADTPARLAVGTNEHRLVAASGETTGLKYVADTTNYAIAAKGDLLVGTAADTLSALTVGTDGYTLVADSVETTGLKWVAPAGSGANWTLLNTGGTALTGAQTITVSGISGKDKIMVLVRDASSANAGSTIGIRLNTDTGSNYESVGIYFDIASTWSNYNIQGSDIDTTSIKLGKMTTDAASSVQGAITLTGCNSSGVKAFQSIGSGGAGGGEAYIYQGKYNSASTISSVSVISSTGNFDAGTVYVYTSA